DTAQGENIFAPVRNWFNEWYAKDISKKHRIVNKLKGNYGVPLSPPPYGYRKDPDNAKRRIIDEEAAVVVRRIYQMALDGYGLSETTAALARDGILNPMSYWQSKGINRGGTKSSVLPTQWGHTTIRKILTMQEYCGDVINFKTYSKSYKMKKRIANDEENHVVFSNANEAVINRETWEKVQSLRRGTRRKKPMVSDERSIFSGLLKCPECGGNLNYHFNQGNHDIKFFSCCNHNTGYRKCTSTHYIRLDFLEQVVLQEIRRLTRFASRYEKEFAQAVMGHSQQALVQEQQMKQRELKKLLARDAELDSLFGSIYEDNVSGRLSDDRFGRMSVKYDEEQNEVQEKIKKLKTELEKASGKTVTADMFISTVRKYTRARKLTPRMLNELINHIEVHQAEKMDGVYVQKLAIHYNCVGSIEIPDILPLPEPGVLINTRKGVAVSYPSSQKAV
ncbi:MAG: recombinase family protein, partial [Ethanoligenens sp.]